MKRFLWASVATWLAYAAVVFAQVSTEDYRGITIQSSPNPTGPAGIRLQNNSKYLADKAYQIEAASDPDADDDAANTGGNGIAREGTRWRNTSTGVVYLSVDDSTGAAVWTPVAGALTTTVTDQDLELSPNGDGTVTIGGSASIDDFPALEIVRTADATSAASHGVTDSTTIDTGQSYASFSTEATITNNAGLDYAARHMAQFQANATYADAGDIAAIYGFTTTFTNNGGDITDWYGARINNPGGTGTYTDKYGLSVAVMSGGSGNNYQLFCEGTTGQSYVGGYLGVNATAASGIAEFVVDSLGYGNAAMVVRNAVDQNIFAMFDDADGDGILYLYDKNGNGNTILRPNGVSQLDGGVDVDNLKLQTNTLSSTDSNGAITLTPNGTGQLVVTSPGVESATLGSELTDNTGWTSTGWTGDYDTGFIHTVGQTSALSRSVGSTGTNRYQVSFTVSSATSSSAFTVQLGNSTAYDMYVGGGTSTTYTAGITSVSNGDLVITPESAFDGTITAISVKQITGTNTEGITVKDAAGDQTLDIQVTDKDLENTIIGAGGTGQYFTTGWENTAFGYDVLSGNTTGFWNTGIGHETLSTNTVGSRNIGIGHKALQLNVTGTRNVGVGTFSLVRNTDGVMNIGVGADALFYNTTGSHNVAVGVASLYDCTTGTYNIGVGESSLVNVTTGDHNVGIGHYSLLGVTTQDANVAIGRHAGFSCTGSNNIFLGYYAGNDETGSNTLYIDSLVRTSYPTESLIYGTFNANATLNTLGINGLTTITAPDVALSIITNDSATAISTGAFPLVFKNSDATNNNYQTFKFTDSTATTVAQLGVKTTDHTNHYGQFEFWTKGSSGSGTRLTIDPNGVATFSDKLGANVTPTHQFDVRSADNIVAFFDGYGSTYHRICIDADTSADSQLSYMENGSTRWTVGNDGSDSDTLKWMPAAGAFAGSEVMTLTTGGTLTVSQGTLSTLVLGNTTDASTSSVFTMYGKTSAPASLEATWELGADGYLDLSTQGTNDVMTVAIAGGKVGFNQTAPATYLVEVNGTLQADDYYSGDGTQGASATTGGATFKDGLYVSGTISAGSASMTPITLRPADMNIAASNPAIPDVGTTVHMVLFDDSTDETGSWTNLAVVNYQGGTLYADIYYTMASATSGKVDFEVDVWAISDGDSADVDTESYDTANTITAPTVPGTAGYLDMVTCTLTNADSVAEGDVLAIRVRRDADDGTNDTATGDAEVRYIVIREG